MRQLAPWIFLTTLLALGPLEAREFYSYALVQEDGSLLIKGHIFHLDGIYIPPSDQQCRTFENPIRCAPRAVLALDFKVKGFVRCIEQSENEDGSLNAICYSGASRFSEGEDLGAYLIEQGWAVALPDAPYDYHVLERIARHQNRGIWGFLVDDQNPRRLRPPSWRSHLP